MLVKEEEIKDHLMSVNPEFRRIVEEHRGFESKLKELSTRTRLTDEEQIQQVTLKKKKLHLKDQMSTLIAKFRNEQMSGASRS